MSWCVSIARRLRFHITCTACPDFNETRWTYNRAFDALYQHTEYHLSTTTTKEN